MGREHFNVRRGEILWGLRTALKQIVYSFLPLLEILMRHISLKVQDKKYF